MIKQKYQGHVCVYSGRVAVSCGRELLFSFFVDSGKCVLRSAAVAFTGVAPGSFEICQIGLFGLVCFFRVLLGCFL
jgi:hypothetical protein